jgi:anti-sigma factor RsiW
MCPSESDLIRLLAGELPDARQRALAEHVRQCPSCAARHAELAGVHELLGAWDVVAPLRDLHAEVMRRAVQVRPAPWWERGQWTQARARVAAAVALAVGAGVAAGVLAPVPQRAPEARAVAEHEVIESLGLDALGGEALGVARVLMDDDAMLEPEETL